MCFIDLSNNRECLILPNGRKPVKVNKILPEDKFSKNTLFKAIIIGIQYAISLFIILAVTNINILLIEKFHSHLEGMSQNLVKYSLVKTISKQKTNDSKSSFDLTNIIKKKISFKCIKRETRATIEKQTTILVLVLSIFFVMNQISNQSLFTSRLFIQTHSIAHNYIFIVYNICAYIFHASNILIYYFFNDNFALKLRELFLMCRFF
jgi:hypothetical protein